VIDLTGTLKVGDSIRIVGGEDTDFTQEVDSMEIDRKKIKTAKSGSSIGLKIKEKAREDYKVYKV
jgi:translation elongation factor EF-Tu-like GTPase